MQTVPEIEGKPAAWVQVTVEDKINIGNFQNVTVTATVGRFVEDADHVIDETLLSLAEERCEPLLADQRSKVQDSLKDG
jgi:hypothetical protein